MPLKPRLEVEWSTDFTLKVYINDDTGTANDLGIILLPSLQPIGDAGTVLASTAMPATLNILLHVLKDFLNEKLIKDQALDSELTVGAVCKPLTHHLATHMVF